MKNFFSRNKKTVKKPVESKEPEGDLTKFIKKNSTIENKGKICVKTGNKTLRFPWYSESKPTPEIMQAFVDTLKLKHVQKFWYE